MPKVLCLVCTRFQSTNWNLGYCTVKNFYLKKLYRGCTMYYIPSHIRDDPEVMLKWYRRRAELAQVMVEIFERLLPEIKENVEAS